MKKLLSLLLCLCLLGGLFAGTALAAAEADLKDETAAQTFAVTMAAWLGGYPEYTAFGDPLFLWDAAGWYAAWLYRTEGCDLLSREEAEDFLRSLGLEGEAVLPEAWEEYGVVRVLRGRDGAESLDFAQHKLEIDEMLGVNTMLSTVESTQDTITTVLSCYYDDTLSADWMYSLRFEKAETPGDFPYRLVGLELLEDGPKMDPALNFSWDELLDANRLRSILAFCPAVRIDADTSSSVTWLFENGGELVRMTLGEDYTGGEFRGCYFEYEEAEDGVLRARIGHVEENVDNGEALDRYLADYLDNVCIVRLLEDDGEWLWLDCTYRGGTRQTVAVDRGTLQLRELDYRFDEEQEPSRTYVASDEPAPDFPFLESWSGPLRTVTIVWEDFGWSDESGEFERTERTTFTRLPADWELLPYEARWGYYTAYLNADYIGDYVYPGDGADYTLYLTTAKG